MEWLVFSVLASMLWALGTVIDKFTLAKRLQNPFSYQLLYVATELPVLLLLFFTNISFASPWFALGIVAGFSHYIGLMLYFRAIAIEEATRVISLFYMGPIFVLVLAALLLKETLTLPMYLGALLLVLGAVSISYRRVEGKRSAISPVLGMLIMCSIVLSVYEVLTKYVLGYLDITSFFFWEFVGFLIAGLSIFCLPRIRKTFLSDVKGISRSVLFWRVANTYLSLAALILYFIAMSTGLVSLVSAATSSEPLFVFVFALFCSLFVPSVLKEDIGKNAVLAKAFAAVLIVVGALLIAS